MSASSQQNMCSTVGTLSAIQDGSLVDVSNMRSQELVGETYWSPCFLGSVSDQCSSHETKEEGHTLRSCHLILDPEGEVNGIARMSNIEGNKLLDLVRDIHHIGYL
jgi:hypothetical protein